MYVEREGTELDFFEVKWVSNKQKKIKLQEKYIGNLCFIQVRHKSNQS